jgi:hypothetical protein
VDHRVDNSPAEIFSIRFLSLSCVLAVVGLRVVLRLLRGLRRRCWIALDAVRARVWLRRGVLGQAHGGLGFEQSVRWSLRGLGEIGSFGVFVGYAVMQVCRGLGDPEPRRAEIWPFLLSGSDWATEGHLEGRKGSLTTVAGWSVSDLVAGAFLPMKCDLSSDFILQVRSLVSSTVQF